MERQTIEWEKIFESHIFHKGLISKIYKELIQLRAQQLVIDSLVQTPSANSGDIGLTSGLGRSPGGGKGTHSSILAWKIPMDRRIRRASVWEVTKVQTWSFFFSFAFCFSSFHSYLQRLLKQPFAFLHLFFLRMVLIPVSCTMSRTSIHSSSGTLPIRSSPLIYFSLLLYNCKGFDLGHIWMV